MANEYNHNFPAEQACKIITGGAASVLADQDNGIFQTCITSPPYWGLRDYGVPEQIGGEKTLKEYVGNVVAVFREVRRVLADNGTLWLNIGDSYTSGNRKWRASDNKNPARAMSYRPETPNGLKPKDLIGIPWRVALALQGDGWYLRSDIIWHKPNCQPESVKDRPTQAHEYLFLFSKSEKYYYNYDAVKEPAKAKGKKRNRRTVWSINTEGFSGGHFAVFPSELVDLCVLAGSEPGALVLDPFFGSGTTGEVCLRRGRKCVGIEIKEEYVEMARQRISHTEPVLEL